MVSFIRKNLKNIIVVSFIIPILLVAFVSISHVTTFYELSNPMSWAIYLSVAIEIAAISALAGLTVRMGSFIYIPFGIVTFIQFVGNMFFAYSYIDETSQMFLDWVTMVSFVLEPMGVESTDIASHKTILALFSGGLLPFISLTFAHMLVVFNNQKVDELGGDGTSEITSEDVDILKLKSMVDKISKEKFGEVKVVNPVDNPEIIVQDRETLLGEIMKGDEEMGLYDIEKEDSSNKEINVAQLFESEAGKLINDENKEKDKSGWNKPIGSSSGTTEPQIKRMHYTKRDG